VATNAQLSILLSQYRFRLAEVMKQVNDELSAIPVHDNDQIHLSSWKLPYNQPDEYNWHWRIEPFALVHDEIASAISELISEASGGAQSGMIDPIPLAGIVSNYLAMLLKIAGDEYYAPLLNENSDWNSLIGHMQNLVEQL
jgi:hypothetical protein